MKAPFLAVQWSEIGTTAQVTTAAVKNLLNIR
jgi:hypothetical protein